MPRGRKPKAEEVEEVVEAVESAEVVEESPAEEIKEEPIEAVEAEEAPVEELAETVEEAVEEKPVEKKKKRTKKEKEEPVVEEVSEVPEIEFNPDIPLEEQNVKMQTTIELKNFTTIYRDTGLKYPLARVYGTATLRDIISLNVLFVQVMFNGRPIVGYIGRGSVR